MLSCECEISAMRERIQIERATRHQGSTGEPVETWNTYATRWANLAAVRGQEVVQSEQVLGACVWKVRLPYDNETKRISHDMRAQVLTMRDANDEPRVIHFDGPCVPVPMMGYVEVRAVEKTA